MTFKVMHGLVDPSTWPLGQPEVNKTNSSCPVQKEMSISTPSSHLPSDYGIHFRHSDSSIAQASQSSDPP